MRLTRLCRPAAIPLVVTVRFARSTASTQLTTPSQSKRRRHPNARHLQPAREEGPIRRVLQPILRPRRLWQCLLRRRLRRHEGEHPELRVLRQDGHPRHGLRPERDVPLQRRHVGEPHLVPQEDRRGGAHGDGGVHRGDAAKGPPAMGRDAPVGAVPVRADGGREQAVRVRDRPADEAARVHAQDVSPDTAW